VAFSATADPVKFEEAIAWFKKQFPVTEELLVQLGAFAGDRAWTIAGVAQLEVVFFVWQQIAKAIENGTPLEEFKKTVAADLAKAWGKADSARVETIFLTNVQKAYNRGRFQQLKEPEMRQLRPFWMYDAILDGRTSQICKARNKTVLPEDDPWWQTNYPPLHFRCRAGVRGLSKREARRIGISAAPPEKAVAPTSGFGGAPGEEEWKPDPKRYPPEIWNEFEKKQAKR
jgi:SPP1 gp7 family putative phage head morphogenesis protein